MKELIIIALTLILLYLFLLNKQKADKATQIGSSFREKKDVESMTDLKSSDLNQQEQKLSEFNSLETRYNQLEQSSFKNLEELEKKERIISSFEDERYDGVVLTYQETKEITELKKELRTLRARRQTLLASGNSPILKSDLSKVNEGIYDCEMKLFELIQKNQIHKK